MAVLNLTPTQIAAVIGLVIAIFIGALVLTTQIKGSSDSPLHIQLVSSQEVDAVDGSTPGTVLTPSAQSGMERAFAGFTNTPGGAFSYSFLQSGGLAFDVHWSSVRPGMAALTLPDQLPSWTNPTTCTAGVSQCGHVALAFPADGGPPGRPDSYALGAGNEEPVDASGWHGQHGELRLNGRQYFVILTNAADIAAGSTLTLGWLPWDGRGAAALPGP